MIIKNYHETVPLNGTHTAGGGGDPQLPAGHPGLPQDRAGGIETIEEGFIQKRRQRP